MESKFTEKSLFPLTEVTCRISSGHCFYRLRSSPKVSDTLAQPLSAELTSKTVTVTLGEPTVDYDEDAPAEVGIVQTCNECYLRSSILSRIVSAVSSCAI